MEEKIEKTSKVEDKKIENTDKAQNKSKKIENVLNKIVKTILNLIYVLLAIIVIILIYNLIQISILNKQYMDLFGYSFFEVKTGSMSGTMEIGDIIIVKLTKDVQLNDIVTYEKEQVLITHRIIEKQENNIVTKGDANNSEDEPITTDEIIGKVVYTFKNVEIWKQVFKAPEVYTLVIITLVLFGITMVVGENKKE